MKTVAALDAEPPAAPQHVEAELAKVVEQAVPAPTDEPAAAEVPDQSVPTDEDSTDSSVNADTNDSTIERVEVKDIENSPAASAVDVAVEATDVDPVAAESAENNASVQKVPTGDPVEASTTDAPADEPTDKVESGSPAVAPAEPKSEPKHDDQEADSGRGIYGEKPEKLTLAQVDSFETFLEFVREAEGVLKSFKLPSGSSSRAALASTADLDMFDDEIQAIAESDLKLSTALSLLITADKTELTGTSRRNITVLAARIMKAHPAFASDATVEQRLTDLTSGEAAPETLPRLITRIQHLLKQPFDGDNAVKTPAARQSLQDNAVHSAVLIAASSAKWDVATCIDVLADNVWDGGIGFADIVAQREKLVALPKPHRKTAALILEVGRARVREIEQERDAARTRIELARAETQRLAEQLEAQQRRITEIEAELEAARAAHQTAVAAHRSERMGATTDFETLRVDLARTISKQVESLEDALDALDHGQAQITKEFVGRSVNTLRVSLSSLQPRTAHDSQGETA